ncbi:putative reverse transcriptase domain-containing protein [Tanacetum coccineum]
MGDENPIRTLGDYSKPSHKGYENTIELPVGNNVFTIEECTFDIHLIHYEVHVSGKDKKELDCFKSCNRSKVSSAFGEDVSGDLNIFSAWEIINDLFINDSAKMMLSIEGLVNLISIKAFIKYDVIVARGRSSLIFTVFNLPAGAELTFEAKVLLLPVIRDCKLEIEGHTFDIDLIPFRHGSFDVIVGMDWLSRHKAEIVCHKKVVWIPLPHDEILRVLGENPEEKVRYLMSAKTEEQKLKDIVVVRNFPEVFPDDLSRLPPS